MKVLIVEDHPMVVQGWMMQIRQHDPGSQIHHASDWPGAHKALMQAHHLNAPFDWVILDVALSQPKSLASTVPALADRIRACAPSVVWVCSALNTEDIRQTCAQHGARWVAKTIHSITWQRLVQDQVLALQAAGEATPWMAAERTPNPLMRLTPRQVEVLMLLARGMSNAEIADRLNVSEETVRTHLHTIFRQLGVRNRTEATQLYLEWASLRGAHGV